MKYLRFFYPHYVVLLVVLLMPMRVSAQNTWAFEQVSPAIHRLDQPVTQSFNASELPRPPAPGATLTRLYVQVRPSAGAQIDSELCTQNFSRCEPIRGGQLYTAAFQGLSAQAPLYVVHRVRHWNGTYSPIYIKVQLNMWWQ